MKKDKAPWVDNVSDSDIMYLNGLLGTYDKITKCKQQLLNMLSAYGPDFTVRFQGLSINRRTGKNTSRETGIVETLGSMKRRVVDELKVHLELWPIWTDWLLQIPGIGGPYISGRLIRHYYYKFKPICEKCGGDVYLTSKTKTDNPTVPNNPLRYVMSDDERGLIVYKCMSCKSKSNARTKQVERREGPFENVSSFWKYCGLSVVDGKADRRRKGKTTGYNTTMKQISYYIGESIVKTRETNPYKQQYNKRKKYRESTHPDTCKNHRHFMAMRETTKLFLSHFMQVDHELRGKKLENQIYAYAVLKHTSEKIEPFFWNSPK